MANISILIPTALRGFTDRQSEVEADAATAGEAVLALTEKFPDIKKHLYDEDNKLRSYINLYVGETNIKNLNGLDTPVPDGGTVMLVPAIAGGCCK